MRTVAGVTELHETGAMVTGSELERLSALETLKGLKNPETVTLGDLVRFLDARGLWPQFAKITLGDLREGFAPHPAEGGKRKAKKKPRILEDELEDAYAEKEAKGKTKDAATHDGGMSTDDFARQALPFIEGNGEVTLDDLEEYVRLDRKVIRHHLGALVKDGRLERIGTGRNALYSAL